MYIQRNRNVGQELLNVPFPEMVYNLASAIAEAQYKLDLETVEILRIMGEEDMVTIPTPEFIGDDGEVKSKISTSMIGAGFQPTFYQFAETIIEVKMAISMTEERETVEEGKIYKMREPYFLSHMDRMGRYVFARRVYNVTPMDARYTNKYSYNQEGESTLRTRLVPVPPNMIMQRFIDLKTQQMSTQLEKDLNACSEGMETEPKPSEES